MAQAQIAEHRPDPEPEPFESIEDALEWHASRGMGVWATLKGHRPSVTIRRPYRGRIMEHEEPIRRKEPEPWTAAWLRLAARVRMEADAQEAREMRGRRRG